MAVILQFPVGRVAQITKQQDMRTDAERVRVIVDKLVTLFVACVESVIQEETEDA